MNPLKSMIGTHLGKLGASLIILVALAITGCSSGGEDNAPTAPPAPTLTGIAISSTSTVIKQGATTNFTATGTFSDSSTADITSQVAWKSSATAFSTISNAGVATGVAAGTTTVTATLSGVTSNSAPLTVIALTSIAITPSSAAVYQGAATSFTAIGTYSNGTTEDLTTQVNWTSSVLAVATMAPATGVATGVTAGTTTVTASKTGVTAATANLTVKDPAVTLSSIAVTPAGPLSTAKGKTLTLTAIGTYVSGPTGDISGSVSWTSTNTAVATVNASGVVSTLSAGTANITATANAGAITSNSIALTVTAPVLATLAITPTPASTTVVEANQFTVSGTLTDGTAATATNWGTLTWTSSNTAAATINSSGLASGVGVGTTNIKVSSNITGVAIDSNISVLTVTLKQLGGALQGLPMALGTAPVTTLAGSGSATFADGTGTAASFLAPGGVTTDGANLYLADTYNHRIRKIVIANGTVTTIAGSSFASVGDGTGASASFNKPEGITTDGTNLYVADTVNNIIRKIVIDSGVVTTLAGSGTIGGQNGTGTAATFSGPRGITVDGSGNLYVADTGNSKIRKIVIATGEVSDFATGLSGPRGVTADGSSLYVANTGDHTIRKIPIATGVPSTLAGTGVSGALDGAGASATFFSPQGITTDGTNLYISDTENHKVRKVVISSGVVSTVAGTGTSGAANNATGTAATFNRPYGVTTDGISLFVSDSSNNLIRKIK